MLLSRIKQLCTQKGITVSELEKNLSFGNGTICKWNSSSPSIDKVKAVAEYFGITIDSLIINNYSVQAPKQTDLDIMTDYLDLTPTQMGMVKLYISILKTGQTV